MFLPTAFCMPERGTAVPAAAGRGAGAAAASPFGLAAAATETEDEGEEVHNLRVVFWFAAVACAVAAVVGIVATRILREENARMGYQMTIV